MKMTSFKQLQATVCATLYIKQMDCDISFHLGVKVCVHVMHVSLIIGLSLSQGFGLYHISKYVNG